MDIHHHDAPDRHHAGYRSLACALVESAIADRDESFISSRGFKLILDYAGVAADPNLCRAAIRARWKTEGRP